MNAYRLVIAATAILAVVLAGSFVLLGDADLAPLFSVVLLAECGLDVAGTLYVLRLVVTDRRRPRSWLLLFMLTGALLITLGMLPIAWLVLLRLAGRPPLPGGFGAFVTGMGLVLVGAVPIMKASLFFLVQRDASLDAPRRRAEDAIGTNGTNGDEPPVAPA